MAASIGVRVYMITLHSKGKRPKLPLDSNRPSSSVPEFIARFIKMHRTPTRNDVAERSWYFEVKEEDDFKNKGYLHYGTFGF